MKQFLIVLVLAFAACIPASATTCNKYLPIFVTSGSDAPVTIAGTSGKLTRICSIVLYSNSVSGASFLLVESSATGCGCSGSICTGAVGVIGGASNIGQGVTGPMPFSLGTGNINAVASSATTGNNVCFYVGANALAQGGVIIYAQETP